MFRLNGFGWNLICFSIFYKVCSCFDEGKCNIVFGGLVIEAFNSLVMARSTTAVVFSTDDDLFDFVG